MTEDKKYIINPNYCIRGDDNRVLITTKYKYPELERYGAITFSNNFFSFWHPYFAAMISFFTGEFILDEQLQKMENYLGIERETIKQIIKPFFENKEILSKKEGEAIVFVPENLIIEYCNNFPVRKQNLEEFVFTDIDLTTARLNRPLDCTLMLNTKCVTNCVYCYADRQNINAELPINKIKKLITEAKQIGMNNFDVLGGELFLYSEWKELLKVLIENGYHPYISTKVPVSKRDIAYMKSIGLRYIQISLDSVNSSILQQMLNVKDSYYGKIKETIENLNEAGIDIIIHAILTSLNSKKESVINLLDYLSDIEYIIKINLTPVAYTRFKDRKNFEQLCCTDDDIKLVNQTINNYRQKYNKDYIVGNLEKYEDVQFSNKTTEKFNKRGFCTGNTRYFYILPDGKVTFCEQMYWSSKFIIGDITNMSIMEFWNSDFAKNFNKNKQKAMTQDSKCFDCRDFEKCHFEKGVCWKMIIESYGDKNWDFPDPRCPKAPQVLLIS
ncbi:MAG: radical SAM protein [Prevotellaceae bacterium]|jgi:radical SAM protein with 4Fe4S-binding SPASM domain|nr:radical SAM protein [Prevotellaceae bacterium]